MWLVSRHEMSVLHNVFNQHSPSVTHLDISEQHLNPFILWRFTFTSSLQRLRSTWNGVAYLRHTKRSKYFDNSLSGINVEFIKFAYVWGLPSNASNCFSQFNKLQTFDKTVAWRMENFRQFLVLIYCETKNQTVDDDEEEERNVNWCDTSLDWSLTLLKNWITDLNKFIFSSTALASLTPDRTNFWSQRSLQALMEIPDGETYLILLWFSRKFFMFMFISAKCRSSKSSSCECVIFNQILESGVNLSWRTSTTWLKDSIFSHVTVIVLANIWWGEQVHGEISRLTEQCNDAPAVNENIVYSRVAMAWRTFSL